MEPAAGPSQTPSDEQNAAFSGDQVPVERAAVAYSGAPAVPNQDRTLFSIQQFLANYNEVSMQAQPALFADMPAAGDFSGVENASSTVQWMDWQLGCSWPFRSFTQLLTCDLAEVSELELLPTQPFNYGPDIIHEEYYPLEGGGDAQYGTGSESYSHHFSMGYEDLFLLEEDTQYMTQNFGADLYQGSYAWDEEEMQNEEGLGLQRQSEISNIGINELIVFIWLHRSIYISARDNAQHNPTCSICLMDLKDGDMLGELECGHKYHVMCIIEWLNNSKTCPLCRNTVMLPN